MRRYWLPDSALAEGFVAIDGDFFHHIFTVCRQDVGSKFEVILHEKAHFVEVIEVQKKRAVAKVLEVRELPKPKKPHIHLALSLPKFPTVDKVIEKSVELGVHSVHLFSSDFSFKKPKAHELDKKQQRWQKIITGATQQSGRADLMTLTELVPLDVLLQRYAQSTSAFGLLAYEGESPLMVRQALTDTAQDLESVWIFVGSEGGFSENDLRLFKDYKLLPVSLGEQVLRVETACVTLVSILKYDLGHFR